VHRYIRVGLGLVVTLSPIVHRIVVRFGFDGETRSRLRIRVGDRVIDSRH
jgi:hypothetical protein